MDRGTDGEIGGGTYEELIDELTSNFLKKEERHDTYVRAHEHFLSHSQQM